MARNRFQSMASEYAEAPVTILTGLLLARVAGRAWLALPLFASTMLLVHALHGWYPLLPLLRRTIATFSVPERRSIGERILAGRRGGAAGEAAGVDERRADLVMPILATILGVEEPK